jgi:hypothetical protein
MSELLVGGLVVMGNEMMVAMGNEMMVVMGNEMMVFMGNEMMVFMIFLMVRSKFVRIAIAPIPLDHHSA